jgi:hypothetical protein
MLLGISIGIALTLAYAALYLLGIMVGVMGTDSCRSVDDGPIVYLFFVWPLVLLVAAWLPGVLLWCKVRWQWVVFAGILLGLGGLASYLIYPFWLSHACHRIA